MHYPTPADHAAHDGALARSFNPRDQESALHHFRRRPSRRYAIGVGVSGSPGLQRCGARLRLGGRTLFRQLHARSGLLVQFFGGRRRNRQPFHGHLLRNVFRARAGCRKRRRPGNRIQRRRSGALQYYWLGLRWTRLADRSSLLRPRRRPGRHPVRCAVHINRRRNLRISLRLGK